MPFQPTSLTFLGREGHEPSLGLLTLGAAIIQQHCPVSMKTTQSLYATQALRSRLVFPDGRLWGLSSVLPNEMLRPCCAPF